MSNGQHFERKWTRIEIEIACDAEETVNSLLFGLGTTGTVTLDERDDAVRLEAYFDDAIDAQGITVELSSLLSRAGHGDALRSLSVTEIADQDWMQKWKEGFEPAEIGDGLLIAPSWRIPGNTGGRRMIRMDPGMAFGTGTHETTRLCLEAIERHWKGGSMLDVGTGTGILAIAAALLRPGSRIIAIDVDSTAVDVARENVAANGVSELVRIRHAQPAEFVGQSFDTIVANLTADAIIGLTRTLQRCMAPAGTLILSGILSSFVAEVDRALNEAGLHQFERNDAGEWSALIARP